MPTEIKEIISEKRKLEDDIFSLIEDFEERNKGVTVEGITITKTSVNSCCDPEIVGLNAKINIKSYID